MTADIPRLAQQAYLAFSQVHPDDDPPWEDLPDAHKEAWAAAVEEVLRRT